MANSAEEFNEPAFIEYDPTPYGGGYDPSTTYGKPLPPSNEICYPPTLPRPNSHPPFNFRLSSIPSPYFDDDQQHINPTPPLPSIEGGNLLYGGHHDNNSYDDNSWFGYGYGNQDPKPTNSVYGDNGNNLFPNGSKNCYSGYEYDSWFGYGYNGNNEYGYGRQAPQVPQSEYIEPCASLFGYFPCLSKTSIDKSSGEKKDGYGEWKGTEEYLFGTSYQPYGYGETRDEVVGYEEPNYGYERHSWMEHPTYVQAESNAQLWSQKLSFYEYEAYEE